MFLAHDRRGYGSLTELITLARWRAATGSYVAHVADVKGKTAKAPHLAGMAGCITLLLPEKDAMVDSVFFPEHVAQDLVRRSRVGRCLALDES